MVESRRRDPSGDGEVQAGWPRKFKKKLELWKCDFLRFGHQILVAVLGTLQDLFYYYYLKIFENGNPSGHIST